MHQNSWRPGEGASPRPTEELTLTAFPRRTTSWLVGATAIPPSPPNPTRLSPSVFEFALPPQFLFCKIKKLQKKSVQHTVRCHRVCVGTGQLVEQYRYFQSSHTFTFSTAIKHCLEIDFIQLQKVFSVTVWITVCYRWACWTIQKKHAKTVSKWLLSQTTRTRRRIESVKEFLSCGVGNRSDRYYGHLPQFKNVYMLKQWELCACIIT